jgi:hypothetical protein
VRGIWLFVAWWLAAMAGLVAGVRAWRAPFRPPAIYRRWWEEAARCVGRPQPMPRIQWYRARSDGFPCSAGLYAALWQEPNRITLARGEERHRQVVVHEMIHQLLPERTHGDSILELLLRRCARGAESAP